MGTRRTSSTARSRYPVSNAPGHREARGTYAELASSLDAMIAAAQGALAGPGDEPVTFNAGPVAVDGVAAGGAAVVQRVRPEPAAGFVRKATV